MDDKTIEELKRIDEDATIEQAVHIIVERELAGDPAFITLMGIIGDLINAETIGSQEMKHDGE